jgi:hypothetical protein
LSASYLESGLLVLLAVDVLPMDRPGLLHDRAVVVRDGTIVGVEPAAGFSAPEGARIVPCDGLVLVPGLIDAGARLEDAGELCQHLLAGVTTLRVVPGRSAVLDLREEIRRGERLGPRLLVSSPRIEGLRPEHARNAVAAIRSAGFEFLSTGRRLTAPAASALIDCANEARLPVEGELPRALGPELGLRGRRTLHGVELLLDPPQAVPDDRQHLIRRPVVIERGMGRPIPRERRKAICDEAVASGVAVVAGLHAFDALLPQAEHRAEMLADPRLEWIAPFYRLLWGFHGHGLRRALSAEMLDEARACLESQRELALELHARGTPLLAGSSAMNDFLWPGSSLIEELEALVAAGLTHEEALACATLAPARALDLPGGSIGVGKPADLVLVPGDPRADVGLLRRAVAVVVRGRYVPRDELERERERWIRTYAAESSDVEALIPKDIRPALARLRERSDGLLARPEAAQRLCDLLVDVDRARDAEYLAEECQRRWPEAWWTRWALARALGRLSENERARAEARAALRLRPAAIEPWLLLEGLGPAPP